MKLSSKEIDHWCCKGWLHLQQVYPSRTLSRISREVRNLADSFADPTPRESLHFVEETEYGPVLAKTERFLGDNEFLSGLLLSPELAETASTLLGAPALLFKERIQYENPGSVGQSPYQDAASFNFINHHVACMIAIDDACGEHGCPEFVDNQHFALFPADECGCIREDCADVLSWGELPVQAGDVVFFDSHTPHRSGPNYSRHPRRSIYLIYNAISDHGRRKDYFESRNRIHHQSVKRPVAPVLAIGYTRADTSPLA